MVPDPRKALVERLLDRLYPVTPNGRTGFAWKEYDATKAELLALLAAARAEVDMYAKEADDARKRAAEAWGPVLSRKLQNGG